MAETSFPILEQPVGIDRWRSVTRGIGSGILDEGGNPYNLTNITNITNATDTATLTVDTITGYNHAIVSGFYHKMDAPETISLPPVNTPTTYYIVLQYDPLQQLSPVRIQTVTTLDTSSGKENLVLWKITRQPNQLLTSAAREKVRPAIAPSIQVDTRAQLPDPQSVLWGTQAFCYRTGESYRASWNVWEPTGPHTIPVLPMGGWGTESTTNGIFVTPATGGYQCHIRFTPGREAEGYNIPTTFEGTGGTLGTLIPTGYRPTRSIYTLCNSAEKLFEARITPAGSLQMRSLAGFPQYIPRGSGFTMDFSWYTPVSW